MNHDHKSNFCEYWFLKTEEDARMITVLVAIDAVLKQMVPILLRKRRASEIHSQVVRDSEPALMADIHDACALPPPATPRASPVNSEDSGATELHSPPMARTLQWARTCKSLHGW